MQKEGEKYQELIVKNLTQEITSAEQAELSIWLNQHPDNQNLYDQFAETLGMTVNAKETFTPDVDAAWNKMKHRISPVQAENVDVKETKVISLFSATFMRIAASVIVLVGLGILSFLYLQKPSSIMLTAFGERTKFTLPDSSTVWLNPNSMLSYEGDFEGNERLVKLNGEAFFDIRRNEQKPFIVLGQKTRVKVLGTSFVVHADGKDAREFVIVSSGKVSFSEISKADNSVTLTAGDRAFYLPGKPLEKKVKSTDNATAWKDNKLKFNDTPLKQVLLDLELYFNKSIVVSNPALLNCRFTGSFDAPDLDAVMVVLSMSVNSTFEKKEHHYILQGAGCN